MASIVRVLCLFISADGNAALLFYKHRGGEDNFGMKKDGGLCPLFVLLSLSIWDSSIIGRYKGNLTRCIVAKSQSETLGVTWEAPPAGCLNESIMSRLFPSATADQITNWIKRSWWSAAPFFSTEDIVCSTFYLFFMWSHFNLIAKIYGGACSVSIQCPSSYMFIIGCGW